MSIEVKNVTKTFGSVVALHKATLTFENEKIYGLLGRNGAGKTTLLNTITQRLFANDGDITIDGKSLQEKGGATPEIYMMSEKNYYPEDMRIAEVFKWTKEFHPSFDMDYAKLLAEKFGLDIKKKTKQVSTGYGTIFKIIIALSVGTPYVFLDEPVLGLDANHREMFYKVLIERYTENPATYVISTHLIEEAANLIEEVVILKEGKVLTQQTTEDLLKQGYTVSGPAGMVDDFINDKAVIGTDTLGGLKTAYLKGTVNRSVLPQGLEVSTMDLQKLFVRLTD